MSDSHSLYQADIKQAALAAHGHGQLAEVSGEAKLNNPLCGDRVRMQVALADGRIEAIAHETRGCLLCRAAASVIGLRAPGQDPVAIKAITRALEEMLTTGTPVPAAWSELAMFEPARTYVSRHRCVLLPFRALLDALRQSCSEDSTH